MTFLLSNNLSYNFQSGCGAPTQLILVLAIYKIIQTSKGLFKGLVTDLQKVFELIGTQKK